MSGDTGVSDSDRNLIFICYSRADITSRVDIRDMLEKRLRALAFEHQPMRIEVFSDEQIKTGADWLAEIEQALPRTRVAVLLTGTGFLASEFVMTKEVPTFLEAKSRNAGITILRVPIRHVSEYQVPKVLRVFKSAWPLEEPLVTLSTSKREKALSNIVDQIFVAYQEPLKPGVVVERPPFKLGGSVGDPTIELDPDVILDWLNHSDFKKIGVDLVKGAREWLEQAVDQAIPLQPKWRLSLPSGPPEPLRLKPVEACAEFEQCVVRLYPRFRDAQFALLAFLYGKDRPFSHENIKDAKSIMRSAFRKHADLWDSGKEIFDSVARSGSGDANLLDFKKTCRCIPLCEVGILYSLNHACERPDASSSLEVCYVVLDRLCHWLHIINRLLNMVDGVSRHPKFLDVTRPRRH